MFRRSLTFVSTGGFLPRASITELAVGLVIVFGLQKVISSFILDILVPIVGALVGGLWFSNFVVPLSSSVAATTLTEAQNQGAVLAYGNFLTVLINFLFVLFASVLTLRILNRLVGYEAPDSK